LIRADLQGGVGVSDALAPAREALVAHRNARTTVYARRLIVERHRAGWPAARIAEQLGVSCATVHKWIRRHREEGPVGLEDRCSRPHDTPARTPAAVEARVLAMRARLRRGAVYLAGELGLMASTVGRILHRNQVPALTTVDPITGLPVRRRHSGIRYERRNPGDLLHVDVKKFGRVPDGGGWRLRGCEATMGAAAQAGPDRLRLPPRRHRRPDPTGLDRHRADRTPQVPHLARFASGVA
jgi:transposase